MLESKPFSPKRISYLKCYFKGLAYKINVVAGILPIMVRLSRICKDLGILHITGRKVKNDNKKLWAIVEYLLWCNYSLFFEDFLILTAKSNDFKSEINGEPADFTRQALH